MSDRTRAETTYYLRGLLLAMPVLSMTVWSSGCHVPIERVVGFSVKGEPITCHTLGRGSDTVLILATIHGDEYAGTPLVQRLEEHLQQHPELLNDRRVVIMPIANPDGFARGTRTNVNGIDLNRNFPASNFAAKNRHGARPLSEPESRAIYDVLHEYDPARVVSIHQPVACIDYDGPAQELAEAMGAWTDLPVKRIGSRPGSLGSYTGLELGIPIITLELPASASDLDEDALWDRYGKTLLAAIRYPETIDQAL